jgi:hypothetical protein
MNRGRRVAAALATGILLVTGAIGILNGLRELSLTLTPLQRSVSLGVLTYGVVGLMGGLALVNRHPSAVWLAAAWGVVVTYVSSVAALAYAGSEATLVGAIASGVGASLIAAFVVWSARVMTREHGRVDVGRGDTAAAEHR